MSATFARRPELSKDGRYALRLKARLLRNRKNRCRACWRNGHVVTRHGLEFAHLQPTGLDGLGRGRKARLLDIRRNPRAYALLCVVHHGELDGVSYRRR